MHYENLIITRAANFLMKLISFMNKMWEKRILEVFSSARKYMESVGLSVVLMSHL